MSRFPEDFIWHVHDHVYPAAMSLLPARMGSPAARAMLLAVALQESRFEHRYQVVSGSLRKGPARGLWQFEKGGGVRGVLTHQATSAPARLALDTLCYEATVDRAYEAIEHNDTLACVLARLLLWTDPRVLATAAQPSKGWAIYLDTWRPGEPHPGRWPANFSEAWRVVQEGSNVRNTVV